MTDPALLRNLTDVTKTSLIFGAWYTDASKNFIVQEDFGDKIINIFIGAVGLSTTAGAVWLQNSTLKRIGSYTNKFQPSTSAASAGYALTRIFTNQKESSGINKKSAIALAGSIAIFAMEVHSKNASKVDFAGSFLFGVTAGCCKSIFDTAAITALDKIAEQLMNTNK